MYKSKRAIVALIGCLILFAAGCSPKSQPVASAPPSPSVDTGMETTVRAYVSAYNRRDDDAMLDCIDPAEAKRTRAAANIVGGVLDKFIGIGLTGDDLISLLPAFTTSGDGSVHLKILDLQTDIDDEFADVTADVELKTKTSTDTSTMVFEMEKIGDTWYIMNIR